MWQKATRKFVGFTKKPQVLSYILTETVFCKRMNNRFVITQASHFKSDTLSKILKNVWHLLKALRGYIIQF